MDFDETFALVARLESIRLVLGISCMKKLILYQMDVKIVFLNGYLNEEVYVEKRKGFFDSNFSDHVFRLKKAHYGLKQAPRAWYERLTRFMISNGYKRWGIDKALFVKIVEGKLVVAQFMFMTLCFKGCKTRWWSILPNK